MTQQPWFTRPAPSRSGTVPINGITYYYEVMGDGPPLLLLHGGLGSIDMFGPLLPQLTANRSPRNIRPGSDASSSSRPASLSTPSTPRSSPPSVRSAPPPPPI